MPHLRDFYAWQRASDLDGLVGVAETLFECAQSCHACADACMGEPDFEYLRRCTRLCLDCADLCHAAANIVLRRTAVDLLTVLSDACETACRICVAECARHEIKHAHCRMCAEVCRRGAEQCVRLRGLLRA